MPRYTVRAHNLTRSFDTLDAAKSAAKQAADRYAADLDHGNSVWCGASCWNSDDDIAERTVGGYAVVDRWGRDVAEGAAVVVRHLEAEDAR